MNDITFHISIDELCQKENIKSAVIVELVEYGVAEPLAGENISEWIFDLKSAYWIKKAISLHQQLLFDWVATSMLIDVLKQNEKLSQENQHLRASLKRLL